MLDHRYLASDYARVEEEFASKLPTHKIVCPDCNGHGRYVNPSIDSHGISADEFYDDPEFCDDYFSGVYDVPCERCHGANVIDEIDRDAADPDVLAEFDAAMDDVYSYAAERAAERHFGY